MIKGDQEFLGYIDLLTDLNWSGLNVWLVGAITGDEDTSDIDIMITGQYLPEQLIHVMTEARKLGPFDVYYTTQDVTQWQIGDEPTKIMIAKPWDRGNDRATARKNGAWQDGLYWTPWDLPSVKQLNEPHRYGANIQLIQNGEQIYF